LPSGDALNSTPPVLAATRDGVVLAGATSDAELAGVPMFGLGVTGEAFVAALDREGRVVWSTVLSDAGMPSAVAVDADDDIVVLAPFLADATSIFPGQYGDSLYLAKLDSDGNLQYERELAFGVGTQPQALAIDAEGALYVAGSQSPESDFPNEYVLLAKYDPDGSELWKNVFVHAGSTAYASSLAILPDGDAVVAGVFNGRMDLGGDELVSDALLGSSMMPNGFVARFTSGGEHVWSENFGGTIFDGATALTAVGDGDVLIGGWLSGVSSIGGESATADEEDGSPFIARLDAEGRARWVTLAGDKGATYGIVKDADDSNFYVVGDLGGSDYLAEFTQAGAPGGTATLESGAITTVSAAVDARGSIWISGSFTGDVDFGNGNVESGGDAGVCLVRLDRAAE
jgi:hypothetical protein